MEILGKLKRDQYDLLIVEQLMPDILPVPLLKGIQRYSRGTPYIVLSAQAKNEQVWTALDCGAAGFLSKNCSGEVLLQTIPLVLAGEVHVPFASFGHDRLAPTEGSSTGVNWRRHAITGQQHVILQYLANGYSNKEIAADLQIAEGTVKSHIASLMRRLGARNRTHVITLGLQKGLLPAHREGSVLREFKPVR